MREQATYWQSSGLELLKATFVKHSFPPHTHEGYVIGLVEGGVEMFHRDKALHTATPNQIILVNPHQLHTGYAGVPEGWTYRTLYPSIEQMQRAAIGIFEKEHVPYFSQAVIDDAPLAERLHDFHRAAERGTRLEQDSTFTEMLATLVSRYADKKLSLNDLGQEHKAVSVAKKFLEAHPASEISLEDLSKLTSLSSFHLLRVFKRDLGISPHAYQIQQRIRLAKNFLRDGKKIAEVALETGFHDQSHMGLHFKRLVGVTPMQFVKGSSHEEA